MSTCALCQLYRRPGKVPPEVGVACLVCLDLLDRDLAAMPELCRALPAMLAPRASGGHSGGHRAPGPRLPVSLDALSLMGPGSILAPAAGGLIPPLVLLRDHATAWAVMRAVTAAVEAREYELGHDGRPVLHGSVESLVAYLRVRLEWAAAAMGSFPTFARSIVVTTRQLRAVAGSATPGPAGALQVGWCPAPGQTTDELCHAPLYADTWADVIRCPACGAEFHRAAGGWDILARSMRADREARRGR